MRVCPHSKDNEWPFGQRLAHLFTDLIKGTVTISISHFALISNITRNRYLKVPDNHAAVNFASKNLPPSVYSGTFLFSGLLIILLITQMRSVLIATIPAVFQCD